MDVGTLSGRIKIDTSDVQRAADRLERLNRATQRGGQQLEQASSGVQKASTERAKATENVAKQTQKASKATEKYAVDTTDLVKSTQVALGPLSGVASRIAAMTAIFNRNNIALAASLGLFTAFVVAMQRSISVGAELERQLLGINAVIEATGNTAGVTAQEINDMAQALGRDTLTSANEARQAFTVLLSFGLDSKEMLEDAALAAQGLSAAMGGGLQSNARRLGRLLEQPSRNLDSLRRAGIQFTQQQREVIERMERTGDVAGAQAQIMDRLSAFTDLAEDEATGLAGAMDTLGENFRQAFENASLYGGVIDTLSGTVNRLADAVQNVADNERIMQGLGRAFETVADTGAAALVWLFENIQLVTSAATALFVGLIAGRVVAVMATLHASVVAAGGAFRLLAGSILGANTALQGFVALSRIFPLTAAVTAALVVFERMNQEVDKVSSSISRLSGQLQDASRRASRIGADTSNMDNLALRFDVIKNEAESVGEKLQEAEADLRSMQDSIDVQTLSDAMREGETSLEAQQRLIREQQSQVSRLSSEYEEFEDVLSSIEERIEKQTKELVQSEKTLSRFGTTISFIDEMESSFMSTTHEIQEFEKELDDVQKLIQRVTDAGQWEEFEEATGRGREAMDRLLVSMQEDDPRKSFARDLVEIQDEIGAMRIAAERAAGGAIDAFDEQRTHLEAILEVEELTTQQREEAAKVLGVQSSSVMALSEAYVELQMQAKRAAEAEKELSEIQDFMAEDSQEFAIQQVEAQFERRRQIVTEALGEEHDLYEEHMKALAQMEADRIRDIETRRSGFMNQALGDHAQLLDQFDGIIKHFGDGVVNTVASISVGLDAVSETMRSVLGEQHSVYKNFATAQAIIAGALAATKAYAAADGNPFVGAAMAAMVAARTGAEIATIRAQEFSTGGSVSGPGTGRSDDIPAMLSNGEFVINADAARRIGTPMLNQMNEGRMPMMSRGGQVGAGSSGSNVQIIDQRSGNQPDIETEESIGPNGQKQLRFLVKEAHRENLRRGSHDSDLQARYNVRRQGSRR